MEPLGADCGVATRDAVYSSDGPVVLDACVGVSIYVLWLAGAMGRCPASDRAQLAPAGVSL